MAFKKGQVPWNKGKKSSEEHRKRLSESHKGKSAWNKGKKSLNVAWNKGKPWSKEMKRKLSKAHKGQIPWMKGKHHTEKTKEKISMVKKGQYFSPKTEFKKGITPWNKGKKTGPAWNKGIPFSEEIKKNMSKASKGKPKPWMLGRRGTNKGKKFSEEHKGKIRVATLKQYESGIFPARTNTKPEREIKTELISRGYREGIDFIHQYKFMDKFMCDFCFPKQKVIVEVYGDFWHANPKKYSDRTKLHKHQLKGIGRDKSKEAYITKVDNHSWTYLVLWEDDIKKDVVKCVDEIEKVLAEKKKI